MSATAPPGQQVTSLRQGCGEVPRVEIPWGPENAPRPRTTPGAGNQLFIKKKQKQKHSTEYKNGSSGRSHIKETFLSKGFG